MWFGWNTELGAVHVANELVCNGIELFLQNAATRVAVAMDGETINYSDDGPGLPYDEPGPGDVSLAEHNLTCYDPTPTTAERTPQIHKLGRGPSMVFVNAVCEYFAVKTWRSGCLWVQHFAEGLPVDSPHIVERGLGRGTWISFRLDSAVFKAKLPCPWTMRLIILEAAHLFPGITLALGNETFHAPRGLGDLANLCYFNVRPITDCQVPVPFAFHTRCDDVDVTVGAVGESTAEPLFRSWANGSPTQMHGTHVEGLRDALGRVHWTPAVAMIHVIMHKPEYWGASRTRLANGQVRKIVCECVVPTLDQWNKEKLKRA
jgi:DNA gyrase subunit B